MKILFITHEYPNYVPDLLLHGLRKLLGADVVEYPRKDCLYNGVLGLGVCPENQLCPSWFPPDESDVDRSDLTAKISRGYFDFIVCDIRAAPVMRELAGSAAVRLVVVDGEDRPTPIPPGDYVLCRRETDGSDYSIPLPMGIPEEILQWIASYDHLPKKYSIGFLGSSQDDQRRPIVEFIEQLYSDALLHATSIPTRQDPNPSGRFGRDEYYRSLQQCRLVLSLEGTGLDTFRFWENAACNCVHIAARFPLFIPHDFKEGAMILKFKDLGELRRRVDSVLEDRLDTAAMSRAGRSQLVKYHLTTARARYFIDRIQHAFGK